VLALLGGALGLLSGSRPWVHATVNDPLLGLQRTVSASGRMAAPVVVAVALVALAGGVALLLAGRFGRRLVGVVLVLAGAAELAAALGAVRQPGQAIADQVTRAVGRTGGAELRVTVTGWPWVAVLAGVLVVVAGALAVLRAHRWSGPKTRYESPASTVTGDEAAPDDGSTASGTEDVARTWDELSRGEDPTR
jgi:uncharacterized membrane protein (TIGR02234 family)